MGQHAKHILYIYENILINYNTVYNTTIRE